MCDAYNTKTLTYRDQSEDRELNRFIVIYVDNGAFGNNDHPWAVLDLRTNKTVSTSHKQAIAQAIADDRNRLHRNNQGTALKITRDDWVVVKRLADGAYYFAGFTPPGPSGAGPAKRLRIWFAGKYSNQFAKVDHASVRDICWLYAGVTAKEVLVNFLVYREQLVKERSLTPYEVYQAAAEAESLDEPKLP